MGAGQVVAGIHCRDSGGGGLPLLLLHGAGGWLGHWPEELRALPGRRVVTLDLPGHGASPPPGERSIASYARRVLALCDALGMGRAAVCGHSMGGAIALQLGLEAPERVAALLLLGTGGRLRVAQAILEATSGPESYQAFAGASADAAFAEGATPELRRAFLEGWRAGSYAVTHGDFAACNAFDVLPRLGQLRCPALVVCGSADRLTPMKYSEALRDRIPGARLVKVPGAGHMVQLEAPGAVAAEVAAFLAGLDPAGR